VFGLVTNIVSINGKLQFILKKLTIEEFSTHAHGYIVYLTNEYFIKMVDNFQIVKRIKKKLN
jgi:hypothetical protein